MNVDWAPGGCQPSDQASRLGCESAENWQLSSIFTVAIVIITQPVGWYSFYHPTEGGRLNRPRHCSKGAQAMRKAVYRGECIQPFLYYLLHRKGLCTGGETSFFVFVVLFTEFFGKWIFLARPSVLWCCWLGGRKGIRTLKTWVVGWWHGYLSGATCRLAHGPADVTATHCLLLQ